MAAAQAASTTADPTRGGLPRHLFVLVHGLQGLPGDLSCLRDSLLELTDRGVAVHLAECNSARGGSTHDGIPEGAARLAEEVRTVIATRPGLTDITLVGNSLGGLYCRYAAALLLEKDGTMAGLRPRTFLTTASPHLGVGAYGYLGLIPRWLQESIGGRALGKSIRELLLADARDGGLPLLVRMASTGPEADLPFLPALAAFDRRVCYANAVNDFLVAYQTASITPAKRSAPRVDLPRGAPPQVIQVLDRPPQPLDAAEVGRDGLAWQRRMAAGLATLTWREVTVAFPGVLPLAHNKIVALQRDPIMTWINKEGRSVVMHQAQSLLEDAVAPSPRMAGAAAGFGAPRAEQAPGEAPIKEPLAVMPQQASASDVGPLVNNNGQEEEQGGAGGAAAAGGGTVSQQLKSRL